MGIYSYLHSDLDRLLRKKARGLVHMRREAGASATSWVRVIF